MKRKLRRRPVLQSALRDGGCVAAVPYLTAGIWGGGEFRDSAARRPYLRQSGKRLAQARLRGLGSRATHGNGPLRNGGAR
jgi:hypothetical protein